MLKNSMPLNSSCTARKKNALKQQFEKKNANEAKRSENQTFPGNWIVCVFPPFFATF